MSDKKHPMSFSVDQEMHNMLRVRAADRDEKISDFVRRLILSFGYGAERDNFKRVVLKIPRDVLDSKEKFKEWLENGLIRQFFPEKTL